MQVNEVTAEHRLAQTQVDLNEKECFQRPSCINLAIKQGKCLEIQSSSPLRLHFHFNFKL